MVSVAAAPPARVLAAFGAGGPAVRVPGGQGRTWRAPGRDGGLVLKPTDGPVETAWRAEVLAALPESTGYRVARPVRACDGRWVAHGWEAWREVPGRADPTRHDAVLRTGAAFHADLAGLDRPAFLDTRDNPWTFGERVAWDEPPGTGRTAGSPWTGLLDELDRARRPVDLPVQAVHGDLAGNVLFAEGLPPAVIDWPVYFRPTSWASAVAVVDLVTWYGAPPTLVDRWAHLPAWDQMLVRALMYRVATNDGMLRTGLTCREHPAAYRAVAELVLARVR